MPNNHYYVTIHCLPAEIGHRNILLIVVVLVLVSLVLVILDLVCHHPQLFVPRLLLRLLLQLLVALTIVGDGNCLH